MPTDLIIAWFRAYLHTINYKMMFSLLIIVAAFTVTIDKVLLASNYS